MSGGSSRASSSDGDREPPQIQAIHTLLNRPHPKVVTLSKRMLGMFEVLRQLYHKISTELPHDIVATPVPSGLSDPAAQALLYNFDEGHCGRFSIPTCADNGATLAFDYVERCADPAAYIRDNLTFPAPFPPPARDAPGDAPQVSASDAGPGGDIDDEADDDTNDFAQTFFSPGLNSLHQPAPGREFATQRLQHYVRVLLSVPMAQIHTGTQMDQGDAVVDASSAPILRALLYSAEKLFGSAGQPRVDGKNLIWRAATLDGVQTALSQLNLIDTPLKKCYRALLDATRGDKPRAVTLLTYSRASVEVMAALRRHIDESEKRGESEAGIGRRLRRFVTVVTIGVACFGFPDGPAYVHVSTWQDVLSKNIGVNAEQGRSSAGRDAVFVHCRAPYNDKSFDSHNLAAVTSQLLCVAMRVNEVRSPRQLWRKAQRETLRMPHNVDEVVAALVVVTSGWQWLWTADKSMRDVPDDRFPPRAEAEAVLEQALGADFVREITSVFPETQAFEFGKPVAPENRF